MTESPASTTAASSPPRLLVAGASGWLGRHVVTAAVERGLDVTALTRSGRPVAGVPTRDLDVLPQGRGARDVVLVNAAGATTGSERELQDANVVLVERLASACLRDDVPLLSVGSAAEYGRPVSDAVAEDHPEVPLSPYGASKLAGTRVLRRLRGEGLRCTVARVFNVVGPPQRRAGPLEEMAAAVAALPPGGGVVRALDASLVRDVASVAWVAHRLVDLAHVAGAADTVNVCTGRGTSFEELVVAMAERRGVPVLVESTAPGGVRRIVGDPRRLHGLVGRPPEESLTELATQALRDR